MCIFCKIINGEIPSFKIYENDDVLCFLDISASTPGHTLVIPKKHYENIFDLDSTMASKLIQAAQVVAKIQKEKLGVAAVNLINNSGELAGQSVMHFHLHVIPRYENDGIKIAPKANDPDFKSLAEICQKMQK